MNGQSLSDVVTDMISVIINLRNNLESLIRENAALRSELEGSKNKTEAVEPTDAE